MSAYLGVAESPRDPRLFELGVKTLERFLAEQSTPGSRSAAAQ